MNGTNSKLIAAFLSFVLAFSLLPSVALASEDVKGSDSQVEESVDMPSGGSEEDEPGLVDDQEADQTEEDPDIPTGPEEGQDASQQDDEDIDAIFESEDVVTDELLVVYKDDPIDLADASEEIEDVEVLSQEEVTTESVGKSVDLIEVSADVPLSEAASAIESDPAVESVQPNYKYSLMTTSTNDPYYSQQYYIPECGFDDAWDKSKCEGKSTIAVLDTGCNYAHSDLTGRILTSYAWDATKDSKLPSVNDTIGHGTNVCGVIGAQANNSKCIAGASYNANILPVRVFDDDGNCTSAYVIKALAYIIDRVYSGEIPDLHVVNMSLGGYASDPAMHAVLQEARDYYDILAVCAGGNGDGKTVAYTDKSYPSDYEECMAVTSLTEDGKDSVWSDYNECKDISAPGEGIITTGLSGTSLQYTEGTSISSPIVASAAALLWAYKPSLTADEVVSLIKSTASPINGSTRPSNGSAGKLEIGVALDKLSGASSASPGGSSLANTNAGRFVTRLYSLVLERTPDAKGLSDQVAALNAGVPAADIAWGFFGSPEFQNKKLTNDQRIDIAYRTMLDRGPDVGGKADWRAKLDAGMSMRFVIAGFSQAPEFKKLCARWGLNPGLLTVVENRDRNYNATAFATRLYNIVLGRPGDVNGLNTQTGALNAGVPAADIAWGFFGSPEFQNKKLTNDQRIDIAYRTMLDRGPDVGGKADWRAKLDAGMSMRFVIAGFSQAPEFKKLCARWGLNPGLLTVVENRDRNYNATAFVTRLYSNVMNRSGDVNGLNTHTGSLLSGGHAAQLSWSFFSAPEFSGRKLSNDQIVEIAYKTMLNRAPDPTGKQSWRKKLDAGMPLYLLIAGFSESDEFQKLCRSYGITAGRLPYDASEMKKYESSAGSGSDAAPKPLSVSIEHDSEIRCGQPTIFTFNASGGAGNYRFMPYSLMVKNGNSWVEAINLTYQSYSTKNTFEYEFVMSGDYKLTVAVIDPPDNYRLNRFTTEFTIAADQGPSYAQRVANAEERANAAWEECQRSTGSTDYERALWLHDWVIDNCVYDSDLFYCTDVDLFADGLGTCEAYHAAYTKLLGKAGIESGRVYDSGHVWTLVKIDGKWYHVDTTHDDTAGKDWFGLGNDEAHLYFGLSTEVISDALAVNGGAIKGQSVQGEAVSLDDNYFMKSGRIKEYSKGFIQDIQSHLNAGDASFELSVPTRLPSAIADLPAKHKAILYSLVAYDLTKTSWIVGGNAASLEASYSDGKLSFEVIHS